MERQNTNNQKCMFWCVPRQDNIETDAEPVMDDSRLALTVQIY
ncbi:MAG: hypothetical protein UR29_C0001G0111 [Candidatus Woesebacteria bacterium GW2011_GWC2_33_12]|uniref:Uncharacterized protein n=1 Tax=Candidatus Woesebacteria bacterium GW2011_GWB1_33_22 TaxID=1618566 RepID=A0A0G0A2W5_9BACT|nr:MAG: hypothetical protein UR29_C0001G0111 [Candidatus Woesebacteria bacterium GW2011_GWC2_33_12]KKP42679.1 MAG: hypothetical protein UR33_C0001G0040 [Candidatus Woesebacteria bacterium GW2011_GWA2_33_20]KKP45546.1 MAG: hypothetical protein UR35_C0001G0143 [Candidatus Woesebacteria bacterium GW2011_GWB1_33_22]KKP47418.1 MAG: hypothetical protein UR37_C0001G0111 [Microgenomates group bacterium GW2011_GWC1_33_28]KKP51164.1 MAG: hypothetical protein UR41_C0001G0111 [Candidatus Woesebacteria bact